MVSMLIKTSNRLSYSRQSCIKRLNKTVGESALRDFVGAIDQFKDEESIKSLAESTNNVELKGLIHEQKIGELVRTGYGVNGIFITNGIVNQNGQRYAKQKQPANH